MGNPAVLAYLKKTLGETLGGVEIDYFKWDFNRHLSDVYSTVLPPERQAEAAHRFMLGTYELLAWLRETFPHAMLETCSGGGGRYDLGMMYYGEQIWTSDNTDPAWRIGIQCASLLGYPAPTMSCHVANRENICEGNPRTLRFRYAVAAAGPLGYEFNLAECSEELCAAVRAQIEEYESYAHLPERGDYYELCSPYAGATYAYYYALGGELLLTALQAKGDASPLTLSLSLAEEGAVYTDLLSGKEAAKIAETRRATEKFCTLAANAAKKADLLIHVTEVCTSTREVAKDQLESFVLAIRDLALLKRDGDAALRFFSDRERATALSDSFSIRKLLLISDALLGAISALERNSNTRLTLISMLSKF
jgi:hypothetical protein